MDGHTLPLPSEEAQLRAQVALLCQQVEEARDFIESVADAAEMPPVGVTYRQRCAIWQSNARATLTRIEGG